MRLPQSRQLPKLAACLLALAIIAPAHPRAEDPAASKSDVAADAGQATAHRFAFTGSHRLGQPAAAPPQVTKTANVLGRSLNSVTIAPVRANAGETASVKPSNGETATHPATPNTERHDMAANTTPARTAGSRTANASEALGQIAETVAQAPLLDPSAVSRLTTSALPRAATSAAKPAKPDTETKPTAPKRAAAAKPSPAAWKPPNHRSTLPHRAQQPASGQAATASRQNRKSPWWEDVWYPRH